MRNGTLNTCYDHTAFEAKVIAAWRAGDDTYTIARANGVDESAVHRIIIAEREARLGSASAAA